jgi:hypothetical protein
MILTGFLGEMYAKIEFYRLSYYSQPVINIRPIEAQRELLANNSTFRI